MGRAGGEGAPAGGAGEGEEQRSAARRYAAALPCACKLAGRPALGFFRTSPSSSAVAFTSAPSKLPLLLPVASPPPPPKPPHPTPHTPTHPPHTPRPAAAAASWKCWSSATCHRCEGALQAARLDRRGCGCGCCSRRRLDDVAQPPIPWVRVAGSRPPRPPPRQPARRGAVCRAAPAHVVQRGHWAG